VAGYDGWPSPVRAMAVAIDAAVGAAGAGDGPAFEDALAQLAGVEPTPLAVVLGEIARSELERAYPDGLDADDAEQLIEAARVRFAWYPGFSPDALVDALTGTLGVSLPEASAHPATVANGLLLVAELLGGRRLAPVLETALRELQRQQTVELP